MNDPIGWLFSSSVGPMKMFDLFFFFVFRIFKKKIRKKCSPKKIKKITRNLEKYTDPIKKQKTENFF